MSNIHSTTHVIGWVDGLSCKVYVNHVVLALVVFSSSNKNGLRSEDSQSTVCHFKCGRQCHLYVQ